MGRVSCRNPHLEVPQHILIFQKLIIGMLKCRLCDVVFSCEDVLLNSDQCSAQIHSVISVSLPVRVACHFSNRHSRIYDLGKPVEQVQREK